MTARRPTITPELQAHADRIGAGIEDLLARKARRFGPRELVELAGTLEGHRVDETNRHAYRGLAEARITRLPAGTEVELLDIGAPVTPPMAYVVTYAITTRNRDRTVLLVLLDDLEAAVGATFEAPTAEEAHQ